MCTNDLFFSVYSGWFGLYTYALNLHKIFNACLRVYMHLHRFYLQIFNNKVSIAHPVCAAVKFALITDILIKLSCLNLKTTSLKHI